MLTRCKVLFLETKRYEINRVKSKLFIVYSIMLWFTPYLRELFVLPFFALFTNRECNFNSWPLSRHDIAIDYRCQDRRKVGRFRDDIGAV